MLPPRAHYSLGKIQMSFLPGYLRSRFTHHSQVGSPTVCQHITNSSFANTVPSVSDDPSLTNMTPLHPSDLSWKSLSSKTTSLNFLNKVVSLALGCYSPELLITQTFVYPLCDSELCIFSAILWAPWNRRQRLSCSPGHNGKMPKWRLNIFPKKDSQCSFGSPGLQATNHSLS